MTKKDAENIILSTLNGLLKTDAENLYLSHIVNWDGYVEDTNIKHTELVIKHLYKEKVIENYKINDIKEVTRDKSYYTKEHIDQISQKKVQLDDNRINDLFFLDSYYTKENKVQINDEILQFIQIDEQKDIERIKISEENFIKDLFTYNFFEKELGTPIDYYVALDNDNSQIIDLVTFNPMTSEIFLVDVKPPKSNVTALRCCMEIQTYYQKLNKEKFINDLFNAGVIPTKQLKIRVGIIIFEDSEAFKDLTFRVNKYLEKLIVNFNLEVCIAGRTETEILEELKNDIGMYGRNQLYLHQLLGYHLITLDTKKLYSEVFAKDFLDNNFYLDSLNIEEEIVFSIEITNREQKYLFNNTHLIPELEQFICFIEGKDYFAKTARDVETTILAYNPKTNEIYFIDEVCKTSTAGALVECLNIQENTLCANHSKIVNLLYKHGKLPSNNYKDYKFKSGLAVYKGSEIAKQFQDPTRVYLQKVVKELDLKIIYIRQ